MLFQTEKLSSFHCCKLWILLYFFVNIESIASVPGSVTGLTVVPQGPGKLKVSWTNPTGLFTSVEVTLNGETKSITDKGTTSQLFDGLSDGTSYTAQVTVKNDLISSGVESAIGITQCYGPSRIDMVFVVDNSRLFSMYNNHRNYFEIVKYWTKSVGELMIRVFGDHVHIGTVEFSNIPEAEFDVKVDGITRGDYTVDAMNKALEVLSVYRPKCPGDYQKIMVLLTDGFSSQSSGLLNEARILQDAGVISFAVGVKNANYAELKIIAYGHEDRIFEIGHFDFLQLHENAHDVQVGIAKTLKITCDPPRTAPENGNVSCTHANELGSECTYTCDAGYTISNSSLLTTYCKIQTTGVGGWSEEPPTCTSIRATYKDEFNYFDSSKWYVEVTGRPDNNELEYYTNRSENYRVENGHLIISPLKENYEGRSYTSARMHSKFSWKYGRVEVRAKLPNGFGLWPAIWMMPKYSVYGGWPQSGEIDIMEARGQNLHQLQSTIHYGKHFSESSGDMKLQCSIDEYHVYTLDWTPTELVYRLDGKAYYRQDLDRVISYMYSEKGQPFDQEFYLILNVAVGGNYLENPKPSTKWNYPDAEMWVDYVRVYSLEDIASQGRNGSWTLNDGGVQEAASECVIKNGTSAGDICGALQWACYSQHYTDVSAQCNAASTQLNCCNSNPYSCNYNDLVEGAGKVFQAYYSQIPSDTSCDFGGVCQLEPLQCTNGYGG